MSKQGTPGTLDCRIVDQDQVWRNVHGDVIPLDQIDARYAGNIMRYLERRADRLMFSAVLEHASLLASDLSDGVYRELASYQFSNDPVEWLRSTPLYRALERQVWPND